jgi:hypothetical protein
MLSNHDRQLGGLVDRIKTIEQEMAAARASVAAASQTIREKQIETGQLYVEARKRVEEGEAGDITWAQWCREVLNIDSREANRKISFYMDPKKLVKRRAQTREKVARHRGLRNPRSPVAATPRPQETPRPLTPEEEQEVRSMRLAWNAGCKRSREFFKMMLLRANTNDRIDY